MTMAQQVLAGISYRLEKIIWDWEYDAWRRIDTTRNSVVENCPLVLLQSQAPGEVSEADPAMIFSANLRRLSAEAGYLTPARLATAVAKRPARVREHWYGTRMPQPPTIEDYLGALNNALPRKIVLSDLTTVQTYIKKI